MAGKHVASGHVIGAAEVTIGSLLILMQRAVDMRTQFVVQSVTELPAHRNLACLRVAHTVNLWMYSKTSLPSLAPGRSARSGLNTADEKNILATTVTKFATLE